MDWKLHRGLVTGLSWAALVAGGTALRQARADAGLTDEKVVSAMKRGVDYLLKEKSKDNWEDKGDKTWPGPNNEKGGITALALYSLLHAGQSLQDEPEYQSKLHWRSAELSPVVAWLSKQDVTETYVVGLRTSALTLLPKRVDEKPGEGPQAALERDKTYVMGAMGVYGGYDYSTPGATKTTGTFAQAWEAYFTAKTTGGNVQAAKANLDQLVNRLRGTFGGVDNAFQRLIIELRTKRKGAEGAEAQKLDRMIKELQVYVEKELPPKPQGDLQTNNSQAKKWVDDIEAAIRTGDPSKAMIWDDGQKKMVAPPKENLPKMLEQAKKQLENTEFELKNKFQPLGDLSNGQYGTLGAWALADYGMELPNKYWEVQDKFWRLMQRSDGSWPYEVYHSNSVDPRPAMGLAGIASLFICQEFVDTQLRSVPKADKNIDAGLAWLNKTFQPGVNFYYMYGVERVGLASGLKFFGTTDWYKEGATTMLRQQQGDGSISGQEYGPVVNTAYALLFLARGRNPVVFNKLQYNGPWNARPRDDAYVTRWLSTKRFEKPINWQSVNLQVSAEEWLDAPILLITGSQDPKFTKEDLEKLRTFVTAGGMIFSTADDGSTAFTAAMKKYAGDICDHKYEMRQLPRTHVLFSKELQVDLPNPPAIWGVTNGVREIWIHSPQDVGADWQMRRLTSKNFELGAALYLYASGMGSLRSKLQPLVVKVEGAEASRTIEVAKVDYAGNFDPEPGAWQRMAKLARAQFRTEVKVSAVKWAALDPKKYKLATLTGATTVTFTDEDAKALRAYLDGGGMLFVDTAGGNAEFAESAKKLVKAACGDGALAPLPIDHAIYTGSMTDGVKIESADFRKYGRAKVGRPVASPELEGVIVEGRARVVFSAWDVMSGWLGTKTWGIIGYQPATSEALGRNLILYAAGGGGAAAKE